MTALLGREVRMWQASAAAEGDYGRLHFTRFNIQSNTFKSRMDYSEDDGKTWVPGNHQRFVRAAPP